MLETGLDPEFPWLRQDPAEILGDSRPHTIEQLKGKSRLWQQLYGDWLGSYNASYVDGWTYLTTGQAQATEAKARLRRSYPAFYKAAGDLKDAVRKRPNTVAARFPWAPSDPRGLLGDARPKDVDELFAAGTSRQWVSAFREWLGSEAPADIGWFDWLVADGQTARQWQQALDPTVEVFAAEIGRLKDRLRETHGNKAERILRQATEIAQDTYDAVNHPVDALRSAVAQQTGPPSGSGAPTGSTGGRPGQGGQGGSGGQGGPGGTGSSTSGVGGRAPQRDPLELALDAQLRTGHDLWPQAPNYATKCRWLGGLLQQWGGVFAETGGQIAAYADAVVQYCDAYRAVQDSCRSLRQTPGADYAAAIVEFRNAVYGVAWTIDLAFQSSYGDWPHRRLSQLITQVEESDNARVQAVARAPLRTALHYICEMYPLGARALDTAQAVVNQRPAGYPGGDAAEPWGTHEIVGAQAEAAAVLDYVRWPSEAGFLYDAEAEQTAERIFGIGVDLLPRLPGVADY